MRRFRGSASGAGAPSRSRSRSRGSQLELAEDRVESLEAARHGARGTFDATGTKRQCFTGPEKWCSGPTRIFNTGDRGGEVYEHGPALEPKDAFPYWTSS